MNRLLALPRVPLATLPTPLQAAPRLSDALGIQVWLKRDDLTGLGLGGNKVRGLEYLIGDALARDCDCLVTGAGPQSNWAMLAALAARQSGLEPHLVFYGSPAPVTGNLLLDELIDAEVHYTGDAERGSVDPAIDAVAEKLRARGRRPYRLPRGGATALGAAGYVRASLELHEQLLTAALSPTQLWLATGSCGTQAGLEAGARWLGAPYEIVGISVSRPVPECQQRIETLATGAAHLLGLPGGTSDDEITVVGGHIGPGYGIASGEGGAATTLVAKTEGVFLDPVFGAKAMGALMRGAREAPQDGPVVFLVSGGAPTLFAGQKGAL